MPVRRQGCRDGASSNRFHRLQNMIIVMRTVRASRYHRRLWGGRRWNAVPTRRTLRNAVVVDGWLKRRQDGGVPSPSEFTARLSRGGSAGRLAPPGKRHSCRFRRWLSQCGKRQECRFPEELKRQECRFPQMGGHTGCRLWWFRDISDTKLRQKLDISYTVALQLPRRGLV